MTDNQNVRKFLDFLGKAEGAEYDTIVGGSKFDDFTKHPNKVGLVTKEGKSTAAGRYQITGTTYRDFAPKLGITDFSPESQDKVAMAIIEKEGALQDVLSGDFNSAIGKLGKRWASLPSSPYSQPKKSQEWVNSTLGTQGAAKTSLPPMEGALKNPAGFQTAVGPSQEGILLEQSRTDAKYGGVVNTLKSIPSGLSDAFATENLAVNLYQELSSNVGKTVDPEFRWDSEFYNEMTKDISPDNHGFIRDAVSQEDAVRRRARLVDHQEILQEQGRRGGVGIGSTFLAAALDLPTLVGLLPGLGGVAMVSRTSRLANALSSGMASAAVNVATEAPLLKYRPMATTNDLYMSALGGFVFGNVVGGMKNPARAFGSQQDALLKLAEKEYVNLTKQELDEAGMKLTPEGEKILKHNFDQTPPLMKDQIAQEVEQIMKEVMERNKPVAPVPEPVAPKVADDLKPKVADDLQPKVDEVLNPKVADETTPRTDPLVPETPPKKDVPVYDLGYENRPVMDSGKLRKSKTVHAALTSIIAKPLNEVDSALAKRLLGQLSEDIPIYVVPRDVIGKKFDGFYRGSDHAIYIHKGTADTSTVHEVAHALTVLKQNWGKSNPNTAHGKLALEIEDLFKQASEAAKAQGFTNYHLQNSYEFTAGLYGGHTSKEFRSFLATLKTTDSKSLLTKFAQAVARLLGLSDGETNLFLRSLDVTDRLIDEPMNIKIDRTQKPRSYPGESHPDLDFHATGTDKKGFSIGLSYENFFNREWVPAQARDLFQKLSGSTTGYKDHAVVSQSAQDHKLALGGGWETRLSKAYKSAFNEFVEDTKVGRWQRTSAYNEWSEMVGDVIRDPNAQGAHPSAVKMADEARKLFREAVDHLNNPAKFNGGQKRGLTQRVEVDPATGIETLSKPMPYNDTFFPRSPVGMKFAQLRAQLGEDALFGYFSRAFQKMNPTASQVVSDRFGKWYTNKVFEAKVERRYVSAEDMLTGLDREGLKESFMLRGKMTDAEAQDMVDFLLKVDTGEAQALTGNLKRRSQFDENYTEQIVMPDGSTHKLGYKDFFETDAIATMQGYLNRTAGAVSLANAADVYRKTDIDRLITDSSQGLSGPQATKVESYLKDQFDNLLGVPVEEFTAFNKSLQMIRDVNVARLMGKAVFNQLQETSQIAGEVGLVTMLKTVPQLRKMLRDVKTGSTGHEMLDQLENLTGGAGADLLRRNDFRVDDEWVRELGDTKYNRWLDQTANIASRSAHGVLKYTGMSGMMVLQKRTHALAMINHFIEAAVQGKTMGYSADRLAWMGMEQADVAAVMARMRQYHKPMAGSKTGKVDFDQWHQDDPGSLAKFTVAFQRNSRRAVQENDMASSIPILGKGWAKSIFQFMNFASQAWNKSLQFSMNHRDFQTQMSLMYGMLFSTAAYVGRTHMEMIGMSAEDKAQMVEERLSVKQIVMNSAAKMQQASLLPNIIDTFSPVPLFSGAKTTSNATDFVGGNPTFGLINTGVGMFKKTVRNSASDEFQTTEKDVRSYTRMLMFNNVVGISNLLNAVAAEYPSNENQE